MKLRYAPIATVRWSTAVLLTTLLLPMAGCSVYGSWVKHPEPDLPWTAPGIRVENYWRKEYQIIAFLSVPVPKIEWAEADGTILDREAEGLEYSRFLFTSEIAKTWGNQFHYDLGWGDAPYTFYLTSIEPAVVVGVPFDHRRQPYHRTFLEINWRIHPDLVTSTKIPAADELVWFSPELRQDIAPLTPYPDGVIRIAFRGVELVLTRHGDDYDVERLK